MLPPGSWFAKWILGLYLATGTKKSSPCHFASYILSFGVKLINGLPVHYFFYLGFLASEFFFWDRPFPLLIFFSSEFISWFLDCPKNAVSGLYEISVISCDPFFPVLWDWDIKKMQQVSTSPLPRLSSFPNSYCELFTMSHIHCAHILYISLSLVPSFSYIMTNWVDMRALMFPWMQEPGWSDSAPSQRRPGPMFAFLLSLAQWHLGRAEACGPEWAVAHFGQGPHLGSCVSMQLRHTIATRLDVAAEP